MITELKAHNFKSWQATGEIRFAPLTGFFGANNSGKTSILQLLLLLKQTVDQPPEWNEPLYFGDGGSSVNLVDFDAVIHRHNLASNLSISVSWELPEGRRIEGYSADSLSFSTSITKNLERAVLKRFGYTFPRGYNLEIGWTSDTEISIFEGRIIQPDYEVKHDGTSVNPFRCYGIVNPTEPQEISLDFRAVFEDLFSRIHYLGPRREDPRHDYSWNVSHPKDVGRYGEKTISALLSSLVQQRSTYYQVMEWLQKLELINSYALNSISDTEQAYEFLVRQYKDGPEVGLTDVGFGVSQVLPLIAQCYYADEGSILILENPEAHLHPKVQSELADVFIDVVKNRNIQIILESHSEHLLLRLMRRIAEEEISVDQTAFHFCQINDGISTAEQLKVDEYGNISNWPQNFFGDDMGDLVEKTKAEMKRRKADK